MKALFPVVVLAGGLATRLYPLTQFLPKALITIHGRPFIEHQLRLLHQKGIREVVLSVGYLGEQIAEVVGDGRQFGLSVSYVFDGPQLLGTAGAIKRALPVLDEQFFVLNGDSYLPCDYAAVQAAFISSQKMGLMTVFHNSGQWDTSNVEFKGGEILKYDKRDRTPNMLHIDYGLEVFSERAFADVPEGRPYDLTAVYQQLLQRQQLAAYEVNERFYENGSFAGIADLERYLKHLMMLT